MKGKTRLLAVCLSTLMLVPAISGCQSKSSSGNSKTVTVAYQISGTADPFGTWLKDVTKQYNAKNPGITIKAAPINADENTFYTKLDLEMKSGNTCPDVVTEDTFLINSDAAAGYIQPISDKVSSWSDWSQFITNIKQGVTGSDGKVYGIPYSTDSRGLWYNKTVFAKAGLPADWQPKSWNDVLAACKAIKEKCPGVVPFWTPVSKAEGEATSMQDYEMLLYGTGERLLDSNNKYIVGSSGILDSLNFISTIFKSGYGPSMADIMNGQASNTASQTFLNKDKLGIYLMGNWITGNYISTGASPWPDYTKNLGFAAMPTEKGQDPGTITLAGGWALSIPTKAKNASGAWDFIKFAMNKDNLQSVDIALGNLTTRSDVATDSEYTKTPFNDVASKFLETAQFRPTDTNYPKVSTAIQTMVESVATGSSTPEKAMAQYATDVKGIVGNDKVVTK